MVWRLIKNAEQKGELNKGDQIIEVTGGNTGISLAFIYKLRDYNFTAIMPANMGKEKVEIMKKLGANFLAAKKLRKKFENVVTIFPYGSDRYSNLYSIKFKAKAGG
jgi:cysteine synthase